MKIQNKIIFKEKCFSNIMRMYCNNSQINRNKKKHIIIKNEKNIEKMQNSFTNSVIM